MNFIKVWFLCSLLGFFLTPGWGKVRPGIPHIVNYTGEDFGGNASPQNWCTVQDHSGILYFGNTFGVLTFNDSQWKIHPLPDNSIAYSLAYDPRGRVYVGAINNFGYMGIDDKGELNFHSLLPQLKKEDLNFGTVWETHVTSHGIYFVTMKKVFRWHKGQMRIYSIDAWLFSTCYEDVLFVPRNDNNLSVFKNGQHYLVTCAGAEGRFGRRNVLPFDKNQYLMISVYLKFSILTLELPEDGTVPENPSSEPIPIQAQIRPLKTEVDDYLKITQFYKAIPLDGERYALATYPKGVLIINKQGELEQVLNKELGLVDGIVYNVFLDRNKNLWATTIGGISMVEINHPVTYFGPESGGSKILRTLQKMDDKIYCGGVDGISVLDLNSYHPLKPNPIKHITDKKASSWDLKKVGDFLLSVGIGGLYSVRNDNLETLVKGNSGYGFAMSSKFPDRIFYTGEGNLSLLKIRRDHQGKVVAIEPVEGMIPYTGTAYNFIQDMEGNLWISVRNGGLIYIEFTGINIDDYKIYHFGLEEGLPKGVVNYTCIFNKELIVSSPQGLFKAQRNLEPNSPKPFRFVRETSLGIGTDEEPANIPGLFGLDDNRLIINYDNYLVLLTKSPSGEVTWTNIPYQKNLGFPMDVLSDGDILWIAMDGGGLIRYDPKIGTGIKKKFHTHIQKVIVNQREEMFNGHYYYLPNPDRDNKSDRFLAKTQGSHQIPTLTYDENSLIFEYSAMFYEGGNYNYYEYMLEGFDREWVMVEGRRKEYTNLPEGDYIFRVKALRSYNMESTEATYKFKILAPWYRTLLAYIGYGLGTLLLFYGFVRLNTRRLINAKTRLEGIVKDRTKEIREQRDMLEEAYGQLYSVNRQMVEANLQLEKLSVVVQKTDNAVSILTPKGQFEWVNEGFTQLYGFTLEELVGERSGNLRDFSEISGIEVAIQTCIEKKESVTYEMMAKTKEGKEIWAQTTLTPILDDDGAVKKLVAIDSDITQIKEARDQIDGILKSVADGLVVTDLNHQVVLVNRAAEAMLGMKFGEVVNQPVESVIQNDLLKTKIIDTLDQSKEGYEFDIELPTLSKDNIQIMRAITSVFRDAEGRARGVVTIIHDVTHERLVDRMKSDFISTAAHELKTPLTSIMGFSELLMVRDNLTEEVKKRYINHINHQSRSLSNIISDILDLSRIESRTGYSLNRKKSDINRSLHYCVDQFRSITDQHDFEIAVLDEPVEIWMDKEKIEQVVQNIISNAVKYSPEGGTIRVRGDLDNPHYRITISDEGIGMTPDQVARIFDRFYRADSSDTAIEGTGLGMSIVENFVAAHGGEVEVKSEQGKGTSVIILLPLDLRSEDRGS